jgi:zinc D-Ala-D-Ala carboxypeptidase
MNLTQNFTLSEMTKSETALRFGMDNTPTSSEIENLRILCENVFTTRAELLRHGGQGQLRL